MPLPALEHSLLGEYNTPLSVISKHRRVSLESETRNVVPRYKAGGCAVLGFAHPQAVYIVSTHWLQYERNLHCKNFFFGKFHSVYAIAIGSNIRCQRPWCPQGPSAHLGRQFPAEIERGRLE